MKSGKFRAGPALVITLVVLLDQLSKGWIARALATSEAGALTILSWLDFVYSENPGVSMSLLLASSPLERIALTALTGTITLGVVYLLVRSSDRLMQFAYALIAGGALGNLIDRVRLGHVVDFIYVHSGTWSFYIFNLADAAISIGVATILIAEFRSKQSRSTD